MTPQPLEKNKPSFLLVSNWHPASFENFKWQNEISKKSYDELKEELSSQLLDIAYLYSLNLNKLGYQAKAILSNHEVLQKKWAKEQGMNFGGISLPHLARRSRFLRSLITKFPKIYYSLRGLADKSTWNWQILLGQIKEFKPDILYIFDLHYFTPKFLKEARKYAGKIVGLISAPIMLPEEYFRNYDLLFSSFPYYVRRFRKMGIPAAYLPFAFESTAWERIGNQGKKYDCGFVGVLSQESDKYPLLEKLAQKVKIDFWGHIQPPFEKSSAVFANYHGEAWGIDMFKIYAQSKIVVNCHTKKVGNYFDHKNYADNVRLYESTGMGAMLITDAKKNLGELFEIGKEIETYNSLEELIEKINYYLEHEEARKKIALAGQKRTLKDHTYEVRAKRLLEIIR